MYSTAHKIEFLNALDESLRDCIKCKLCDSRTNLVFGEGNPNAKLVFVGEGPGADEDKAGRPFVGAAGVILTKMIRSLGLERKDIYICNTVKCRPPGNRNPNDEELTSCKEFLYAQLEVIQPKVICSLGAISTQLLLNVKAPISKLRGKVYRRSSYIIVPTFHPAYLFRSYSKKVQAWEDLKVIERELQKAEMKEMETALGEGTLF